MGCENNAGPAQRARRGKARLGSFAAFDSGQLARAQVIMTGDSASGYAWDKSADWYRVRWANFTQPFFEFRQRYAYALGQQPAHSRIAIDNSMRCALSGNHDDQADFSRQQIIELDRTNPYSLTEFGPAELPGVTNFRLPVLSSKSNSARLLCKPQVVDS